MCVGSILSNMTGNKAFDLPAYAERESGFLWGGKWCGRSRGFCCVCFGDVVIKNNEFAFFAAVKERRACLNLAAMGLSASLAQSDPYPESRPG